MLITERKIFPPSCCTGFKDEDDEALITDNNRENIKSFSIISNSELFIRSGQVYFCKSKNDYPKFGFA